MVFAAVFASLTAAVAWFKIPLPFTPVPVTLQTVFVLLSGAMLGPVYGALAMIIYILLGAIGLPVFSGGSSGLGVLFGPTGGYLFSFPVAAFVIGWLIRSKNLTKNLKYLKKYYLETIFAMIIGMLIIYTMGGIQGMLVTGLSAAAIISGWVLPFIFGDIIKLLLAAWISKSIDLKKYIK